MSGSEFTKGQTVRRVGESNLYLNQGEAYTVSKVVSSGMIKLAGYRPVFKADAFRAATNIKPIPDYEATTMNTDDNEIDLAKLSHQTTVANLEAELGEAKEELEKMNRWWYDEKIKCEALRELVVKQATKLMG